MESLAEFTRRFGTVDACLRHLEAVRWAGGEFCPLCGGDARIHHYSDGRRHRCGECGRVFRIITGTVFTDSPIRLLPRWFAAVWLETRDPGGVSSAGLARTVGVTQKTAWHMLRRIRHAADAVRAGAPGRAAAPSGPDTPDGGGDRRRGARRAGGRGRDRRAGAGVPARGARRAARA